MRLLIISHTPHYINNGVISGWGPTIQEIDALSTIFDEVVHLGCLLSESAPASSLPYSENNVKFIGLNPAGGSTLSEKLKTLKEYPVYYKIIKKWLPWCDVVHVRCPANIPLLAVLLLATTSKPKYRWAKYAGNWKPDNRTPFSFAFQRFWLYHAFHRGVTTINGSWLGQPKHVISFYNPSLTDSDIALGRQAAATKQLSSPVNLLFVGAITDSKGIFRALQVALHLKQQGIPFDFKVLGDGPDRDLCEIWVAENNLGDCIHFTGWIAKNHLAEYYSSAHILIHPTRSDGWPKVLSEAMAYGVVPIAGAISCIPQILAETGAGISIAPNDINDYVEAIKHFINQPERWKQASNAGVINASLFTYRSYLTAVKDMFLNAWSINLAKTN